MMNVAVYVDDLIIIMKTPEKMDEVKKTLASQFKMKDLGKIHYCLGISIEHDESLRCVWMHQKQCILTMIDKCGLSQAKTVATPADVSVQLQKDDGASKGVDPTLYQSIVRSLLYTAIATRPDIAQAVGVVSKFSCRHSEAHLTAVKCIMKYLKGTASLALKFERSEDENLIGFSDADWAGDLDDRHSTTGDLFLMAGGPVSWLSKKQPVIALSNQRQSMWHSVLPHKKQSGSGGYLPTNIADGGQPGSNCDGKESCGTCKNQTHRNSIPLCA